MQDVFELQDEIARKIAEALRVTLSPQEQEALAAKPTANLQAYDLFLRGKSYARRRTRQDFEFALQMFEHAVTLDPAFALAYRHRYRVRADPATTTADPCGWNGPSPRPRGEGTAAEPSRGARGLRLGALRRGAE